VKRGLLVRVPTDRDLERLYHELARHGAASVGRHRPWPYRVSTIQDLLALAGEMLRFDARLLSILVQLVLARWLEIDPAVLRRRMHEMRWPQALAVAFEFVHLATLDPELRHLAEYVRAGWPRVDPPERFFFDVDRPGSRTGERRLGRNLAPYAEWGFIGVERPTVDSTKRALGRYDAATRRRILERLLGEKRDVSILEYLDAVDRTISRQQARNDLVGIGARRVGGGRGARWRVKARA